MVDQIDRSEYQETDDECCPGCGWDMIQAAFDENDGVCNMVEVDKSVAPPDVQSAFYECYSATWLITCSHCGTKFAAEYDNY